MENGIAAPTIITHIQTHAIKQNYTYEKKNDKKEEKKITAPLCIISPSLIPDVKNNSILASLECKYFCKLISQKNAL